MTRNDFKSMSIDELWELHEKIAAALAQKMIAEKKSLEDRLRKLKQGAIPRAEVPKGRRPYPTVIAKFRNPDLPSETWAGRGKQPRWLIKQLRSGKRIDDFRIKQAAA